MADRNVVDVRDGVVHRSVYRLGHRSDEAPYEHTLCGTALGTTQWAGALHLPVTCMRCIDAGA